MTIARHEATRHATAAVTPLSTLRLNLMRVGYLLMVVGLAPVKWPLFFRDGGLGSLPVFEGVVAALLTAMSLLALAGDLDGQVSSVLSSVSLVVVILAVTPWDHVWRRYVRAPGTPWGPRSVTKVL